MDAGASALYSVEELRYLRDERLPLDVARVDRASIRRWEPLGADRWCLWSHDGKWWVLVGEGCASDDSLEFFDRIPGDRGFELFPAPVAWDRDLDESGHRAAGESGHRYYPRVREI